MKKGEKKFGFTMIEVSLVMAIAGLIFLAVFIAFPALRRSQRDAERKDNILLFLENVKKYQTNNRGALPTDWNEFKTEYFKNTFLDPDGEEYSLAVKDCKDIDGDKICDDIPADNGIDYTLYIFKQATCGNENSAVPTSNPRNIAVMYRVAIGGWYCANT